MLLIKPGIWSSVIAEDKDFIERLKYRLTISDSGYKADPNHTFLFYKEVIPGFQLDIPTGILESHVLPYVHFETVFDVREESYKYVDSQIIVDAFTKMSKIDPSFEVRPHQVTATVKCLSRKHGICELQTGSGKTEIISALCSLLSGKILIINNRHSILKQIQDRLALRGITKRIEEINKKTDFKSSEILVSTNNLIYNKIKKNETEFLDYLKDVRTIIVDECHHASAVSQLVPILISEPEYLIGFTASKHKGDDSMDDLIINSVFGESIYFVSSKYLRSMGYLAEVYAYYVDYPQKKAKWKYKHESSAYDDLVMNNFQRNEKIIKITEDLIKNGLIVTLFVSRLEHGKFFVEEFKQRGIEALFFCGQDRIYKATDELVNGKYVIEGHKGSVDELKESIKTGCHVVIGNVVLNEGIDIPAFDAGILVDAGKNVISHVQRLGRICRKKKNGLNAALFVDFNDSSNETMSRWTNKRKSHLQEEGISVISRDQFYEFMKKIGDSRNG